MPGVTAVTSDVLVFRLPEDSASCNCIETGKGHNHPHARISSRSKGVAWLHRRSPIGSRRRLGAELRRLRNRSGLTLDDAAEPDDLLDLQDLPVGDGQGHPEGARRERADADLRRGLRRRSWGTRCWGWCTTGGTHGWWEPLTEGRDGPNVTFWHPWGGTPRWKTMRAACAPFDMTVGPRPPADSGVHPRRPTRRCCRTTWTRRLIAWSNCVGKRQEALRRRRPGAACPSLAVMDERAPVGRSAARMSWFEQLERLGVAGRAAQCGCLRVLPFGSRNPARTRRTFRAAGDSGSARLGRRVDRGPRWRHLSRHQDRCRPLPGAVHAATRPGAALSGAESLEVIAGYAKRSPGRLRNAPNKEPRLEANPLQDLFSSATCSLRRGRRPPLNHNTALDPRPCCDSVGGREGALGGARWIMY